MLSQISESKMHLIRVGLASAWLLLIASLFYDPISHHLTASINLFSPFRAARECVLVQGKCLDILQPYPIGMRIFWGIVIPSAIMILLVCGHETWRRICPLYFLSQIPRALGLKPRLNIHNNTWLVHHHLYLQFLLLFIGITSRILFINSHRILLGGFLLFTIASAIGVVYLYGGRSWCHYICPFGIVQIILTGPRGLLGSEAHQTPTASITQSMCRITDPLTGQEKPACMSCKSPCLDIDAERSYWEQLTKSGRKFIHYGYLGLVVGYVVYYYLYAGNWTYYFSGVWSHEANQLSSLLNPGFYISGQPIFIPKLMAAPLILGVCIVLAYLLGIKLEKAYKGYLKRRNSEIPPEQVLHRLFSIWTFAAFNVFFMYGGRPEILRFPVILQLLFNGLVVGVSTLWLARTWNRSVQDYTQESLAQKLARKLKKFPVDWSPCLDNRGLEALKANQIYILAQVLPLVTEQSRKMVYKGVIKEAIQSNNFKVYPGLDLWEWLRQQVGLTQLEHDAILREIQSENLGKGDGNDGEYRIRTEIGRPTRDISDRTQIRSPKPSHPRAGI
ncbi:4Fe-4S binding protein [Oscillatoria acuminata]|uniref:4Fe-4S ferredoxin-type domain-containing protein n=1 Tax=Oscillatoria acuminata PCC 6304 TaxID=56110 RepID=K9TN28_9CYAN|nr:4Fe-4S binding protein [Oscillatoria acuminata]AFY83424.1 hypothetical protein Oscil6304_3870 [Oscillatoria acuminata PCC 6304]